MSFLDEHAGVDAAASGAIWRALGLNFALRTAEGIEVFGAQCTRELRRHYRVPLMRCIVRTRVRCQAGRARAADTRGGEVVAWLCERAPLWVVVQVCALLRGSESAGYTMLA